jgi:hypothetical protein
MNETKKSLKLSEFLSYIKDQVRIDLLKANAKNIIKVEGEQLEKVSKIISLSIESNFIKGSFIFKDGLK